MGEGNICFNRSGISSAIERCGSLFYWSRMFFPYSKDADQDVKVDFSDELVCVCDPQWPSG